MAKKKEVLQLFLNSTRRWMTDSDLAQLEAWAAQNAEVTVVDARGTSRQMVFLPGLCSFKRKALVITLALRR